MREQLWRFHLSKNVPRKVSYESLANISDGLCGGDIKNITIKLGLKLLTGKVKDISESLVKEEIERYLEVKITHNKKILLSESIVTDSEQNSNIMEE